MPPPPPEHPLRKLRRELAQSGVPHLKKFGTQKGFADLVGRSESLIRNVESGIIECSTSLAALISEKTGVSGDWLLGKDPADEIRSADGSRWSPTCIPRQIEPVSFKQAVWNNLIFDADARSVGIADLLGEMTKIAIDLSRKRRSDSFLKGLGKLLLDHGFSNNLPKGEAKDEEALQILDDRFPYKAPEA